MRQPTLVLTGDDDPIIPVVNGHLLAALIRRCWLHVYRGGHLELIAQPERVPQAALGASAWWGSEGPDRPDRFAGGRRAQARRGADEPGGSYDTGR